MSTSRPSPTPMSTFMLKLKSTPTHMSMLIPKLTLASTSKLTSTPTPITTRPTSMSMS